MSQHFERSTKISQDKPRTTNTNQQTPTKINQHKPRSTILNQDGSQLVQMSVDCQNMVPGSSFNSFDCERDGLMIFLTVFCICEHCGDLAAIVCMIADHKLAPHIVSVGA